MGVETYGQKVAKKALRPYPWRAQDFCGNTSHIVDHNESLRDVHGLSKMLVLRNSNSTFLGMKCSDLRCGQLRSGQNGGLYLSCFGTTHVLPIEVVLTNISDKHVFMLLSINHVRLQCQCRGEGRKGKLPKMVVIFPGDLRWHACFLRFPRCFRIFIYRLGSQWPQWRGNNTFKAAEHMRSSTSQKRMQLFCLQLEASCLQWSFFTYNWQL